MKRYLCLLSLCVWCTLSYCQNNIDSLFQEGVELYQLGRDYEAIDCFIKVDSLCRVVYDANDVRNEYHKVYLCRLMYRNMRGRGRRFSENYGYTPINMLQTKNIDMLCNEAFKKYALGNYQQAIDIQKTVAEHQKRILGDSSFCYVNSLLFIGDCLDSLKDYSQAISVFKEALNIQYRILDSTENYDKVLNTILRLNIIYRKDTLYENDFNASSIEWAKVLMKSSYSVAMDDDVKAAESYAELALNIISKFYHHDSPDYLDQLYNYWGVINLTSALLKRESNSEEQKLQINKELDILKEYESTCLKIGYINHYDYLESLRNISTLEIKIGNSVSAHQYSKRLKDLVLKQEPSSIVNYMDLLIDEVNITVEQQKGIYDTIFSILDSAGMHYSESYIKLLDKLESYYFAYNPQELLDNCLSRIEIKRHISPGDADTYAEKELHILMAIACTAGVNDTIKIRIEEARLEQHRNAYGKDAEYINILSDIAIRYANIRQHSKAKSLFEEVLTLMDTLKLSPKQRSSIYKKMVHFADLERDYKIKELYVEKTLDGLRIVKDEEDMFEYLDFLKELSTQWELTNLTQYHDELIKAYKRFKLTGVIIDRGIAYDDEAMFNITYYRWFYDPRNERSLELENYARRLINYYKQTNNLDINRQVIERVVFWYSSYCYIMGMNQEGIDFIEYYNERFPTKKSFELYNRLVNLYQNEHMFKEANNCLKILSQMIQQDAIPIVLYNTANKRELLWNDYLYHANFIESHFYPYYFDCFNVGSGFTFRKDGRSFVVTSVIAGSPADISGIVDGDVIKKINDISIDEKFSASDVSNILKGEKGTLFKIELFDASGHIKKLLVDKQILRYKHQIDLADEDLFEQMYNLVLLRKNFLLMANIEFEKAVNQTGDKKLIEKYHELLRNRNLMQNANQYNIDTETYRFYNANMQKLEADEFSIINEISKSNDFFSGSIIDFKQVKNSLNPDEVAIEFLHYSNYSKDTYAVIGMTSDSKSPFLITQFGEDIIAHMASPNHVFDNNDAELINDLIWAPLFALVPNIQTIFFSPDGIINMIPIECLLSTNIKYPNAQFYRVSSTKQICKRNKQSITPTSAVLFSGINYDATPEDLYAHRVKPDEDEEDELQYSSLIAYNNKRDSKGSLPGTKVEVNKINKVLTEANVHVQCDTAEIATEEAFKALSGKHKHIIHLATHGFYWQDSTAQEEKYFTQRTISMENNNTPKSIDPLERCGLLLAGANTALEGEREWLEEYGVEDGVLTAKEISTMDLRDAELVVLSACETGLGDITGDGVFGLQRAFKMAGAKTIIMSLWKVDDNATQLLMSEFYKNWITSNGKLSKREAFHKAQNVVRSQYNNPVDWAGFIILD